MAYHPSILAGKPADGRTQRNPTIKDAQSLSKAGARRKAIMSKVFFALERRGGDVDGNEDWAAVKIGDQRLTFRVFETLRKIKLPTTDWDRQWNTSEFRRGYRVGLEPTGALRFEIETYLRGRVQQVWQDAPALALERRTKEFVAALIEGAKVRQEWVNEERAAANARDRASQVRNKAAKDTLVDGERWQTLVRIATAQNEAQMIVTLINSLAPQGEGDKDAVIGDRTLRDWLDWLDTVLEQQGVPRSLSELFSRVHAVEQRLGGETDGE